MTPEEASDIAIEVAKYIAVYPAPHIPLKDRVRGLTSLSGRDLSFVLFWVKRYRGKDLT